MFACWPLVGIWPRWIPLLLTLSETLAAAAASPAIGAGRPLPRDETIKLHVESVEKIEAFLIKN